MHAREWARMAPVSLSWSLQMRRVVIALVATIMTGSASAYVELDSGGWFGPYRFRIGSFQSMTHFSTSIEIKSKHDVVVRECGRFFNKGVGLKRDCLTYKPDTFSWRGDVLIFKNGDEDYYLDLNTRQLRIIDDQGVLFDNLKPGNIDWSDAPHRELRGDEL